MEKPKVWLIDENDEQLNSFTNILQANLPKNIEVQALSPINKEVADYTFILQDPDTACIIIDQKLKDTGIVNFLGIDLAQFLRSVNTKLPIYILTNFPGEF